MAINKQIEHTTGDTLDHHVILKLAIDRVNDNFKLVFGSFEGATRYSDGKEPSDWKVYNFKLSELPSSVGIALGSLKDSIEEQAHLLDEFVGGTIVNDDGTTS